MAGYEEMTIGQLEDLRAEMQAGMEALREQFMEAGKVLERKRKRIELSAEMLAIEMELDQKRERFKAYSAAEISPQLESVLPEPKGMKAIWTKLKSIL